MRLELDFQPSDSKTKIKHVFAAISIFEVKQVFGFKVYL